MSWSWSARTRAFRNQERFEDRGPHSRGLSLYRLQSIADMRGIARAFACARRRRVGVLLLLLLLLWRTHCIVNLCIACLWAGVPGEATTS